MKRITIFLATVAVSLGAGADYQPDIEAWNISQAPPQQTVVVRDATIWTASDQGVLADADLVVRGGRILAVGTDLDAPDGAVEIDGSGRSGPRSRKSTRRSNWRRAVAPTP